MRHRSGYKVWATEAESKHQGGISIVWKYKAGYQVEAVTRLRPNVASFKITSAWKRRYTVRTYVPPNDQPGVHQVEQALAHGLEMVEMLQIRDLNDNLVQPWY